jgi:hypothetical protein
MPEGYTLTADNLKRFNHFSPSTLSGTPVLLAQDPELTSPPYVDSVLRGIRTFQQERIISPALDGPSAAVWTPNALGEAAKLFLGDSARCFGSGTAAVHPRHTDSLGSE